MSAFYFSIFTAMSVLCTASLLLELLISFKTSSSFTFEKPKPFGLSKFIIANTL